MITWWLDLQLPMQSVPISSNIVGLNPAHSKVHSMQHYAKMKFISDLPQVGGLLCVSSSNKTDLHDIIEIMLKVALNTITLYVFVSSVE